MGCSLRMRTSLVSIRKLWMDTVQFSYGKRAIFPKVKETKRLHGGVAVYAAHARARIDAELGEKSRFRIKTNWNISKRFNPME